MKQSYLEKEERTNPRGFVLWLAKLAGLEDSPILSLFQNLFESAWLCRRELPCSPLGAETTAQRALACL
jgi:hypothetical protein